MHLFITEIAAAIAANPGVVTRMDVCAADEVLLITLYHHDVSCCVRLDPRRDDPEGAAASLVQPALDALRIEAGMPEPVGGTGPAWSCPRWGAPGHDWFDCPSCFCGYVLAHPGSWEGAAVAVRGEPVGPPPEESSP